MIKNLLLIGLGGGVGSILRYLLSTQLKNLETQSLIFTLLLLYLSYQLIGFPN
jgi:fluoride ion exporter CrcB/FEX